MSTAPQVVLSDSQVAAFDHLDFVGDQARAFGALMAPSRGTVVDIGGGCGSFAKKIATDYGADVRVVDLNEWAVRECAARGISAVVGDALKPVKRPGDAVVCFNLVLHHLVGRGERVTRDMQVAALAAWRDSAVTLFVHEYLYTSFLRNISAALIFAITSNKLLSLIAGFVGRFVPALRANTLGVGVRFREESDWRQLFAQAGWQVTAVSYDRWERVDHPLLLLLVRSIRRASFRLERDYRA